jgi:hypothetical protein
MKALPAWLHAPETNLVVCKLFFLTAMSAPPVVILRGTRDFLAADSLQVIE